MNYSDYLESDWWKARRAKKLEQMSYRCEVCGNPNFKGKPLQVHHLNYKRLYGELDSDLQVLCFVCHTIADKRRKANEPPLKSLVHLFQKIIISRKGKRAHLSKKEIRRQRREIERGQAAAERAEQMDDEFRNIVS